VSIISRSVDIDRNILAICRPDPKISTLRLRLSNISMAHRAEGHPSPIDAIEVKRVMQGPRRQHGTATAKKKPSELPTSAK